METEQELELEIDVKHYIQLLWDWKWIILLCIILAGGAAFFVSQQIPPVYESSSTLRINQAPSSIGMVDYQSLITSERLSSTYAEILQGRPVLQKVIENLHLNFTYQSLLQNTTVTSIRDTQLLEITVRDGNPQQAADIANEIVNVFITQEQQTQSSRYDTSRENLKQQLVAIEQDIDATQRDVNRVIRSDVQGKVEYERLQTQLAQYRNNYTKILQSLEEVRLAEAQNTDNLMVVETAIVVPSPVSPRPLQNTLLAMVAGAMLAIGGIFLKEFLNDTIHSNDRIEHLTSLPVLVAIGQIESKKSMMMEQMLITANHHSSPIEEAYRVLRANIEFSSVDQDIKTLVVTSSGPKEGKSTTVANLAVVIAQTGKRVVVVDADLRRPMVHMFFGMGNARGLTTALLDDETPVESYVQPSKIDNLSVMPSGSLPPNPAELLGSQRMQKLSDDLKAMFDVVLFDTPPVMAVVDANLLARASDATLMIVMAMQTRAKALVNCKDQLEHAGARIIGTILNQVPISRGGYYNYHYHYYHDSPNNGKKRKQWITSGVAMVVLLLVMLLSSKAWHISVKAQELRSSLGVLETFAQAPAQQTSLEEVTLLLEHTHQQAEALQAETQIFYPISHAIGWLPTYGDDIANVEPLLHMVIHTTAALQATMNASEPLMQATEQDGSPTIEILEQLSNARPELEQANQYATQAMASFAQVRVDELSPSLQSKVARIAPMLPLLERGLALSLATSDVANSVMPIIETWHHDPNITPQMITQLHSAQPQIEQSLHAFQEAATVWQQVPIESLPQSVQAKIAEINTLLNVVENGLAVTLTADELLTVMNPVLNQQCQNIAQPKSIVFTKQLVKAQPLFLQARQEVLALSQALLQLDSLTPQQIEQVIETRTSLEDMLDLAIVAPALLGANESRDYLLIAQNPDEIRATGGFLSNAGILSTQHSDLTIPSLTPSERIDKNRLYNGPYYQNPEPLSHYMDIQQWAFRDSNWSPDFPTAVRTFRWLYNISQDTEIANVIAFDPYLLQMLLEATGPLPVETVKGKVQTISSQDVLKFMRGQYTEGRQIGNKDAIIDPLFNTILSYILDADSEQLDAIALTQAFINALNQRHLMIYVEDPDTAAILARQGWDGAVRSGTGDFIMVVESNVGYNKSNPNVKRAISYYIDMDNPKTPFASLALNFQHTGKSLETCYHHYYESITDYQDMVNRCYWNYLRVLLPANTTLIEGTSYPTPAAWLITDTDEAGNATVQPGVAGTTEVSNFFVVPAGEERTVTYQYQLPNTLVKQDEQGNWHYQLNIQKQAGIFSIPVHIAVRLPENAHVLSSSHQPACSDGSVLTFAFDMAEDEILEVVFR